jgi:hypothetical protein
MGRLAITYPDQIPTFVDQFTQYLAVILQNPSMCERLRGHAASAMINLYNPDHCENDHLEAFVEPLLQSLLSALSNARNEVRAPCLSVIG